MEKAGPNFAYVLQSFPKELAGLVDNFLLQGHNSNGFRTVLKEVKLNDD